MRGMLCCSKCVYVCVCVCVSAGGASMLLRTPPGRQAVLAVLWQAGNVPSSDVWHTVPASGLETGES